MITFLPWTKPEYVSRTEITPSLTKRLCEEQWRERGVRHNWKRVAWQICHDPNGNAYIVVHHFTAIRWPGKKLKFKTNYQSRYTPTGLRFYREARNHFVKKVEEARKVLGLE